MRHRSCSRNVAEANPATAVAPTMAASTLDADAASTTAVLRLASVAKGMSPRSRANSPTSPPAKTARRLSALAWRRRTRDEVAVMFGELYERALAGERCFLRQANGHRVELPVQRWLGNDADGQDFDDAVLSMCDGSTIELGCGPGRLVARLCRTGVSALGVDRSPRAVERARGLGAPVLRADVFASLPGEGRWRTVLLIDGNIGLGADPRRILRRSRELLADGGHCVVEFDAQHRGITTSAVRLETDDEAGPWFPWAAVGLDSADELAERSGMRLKDVQVVGERAVVSMARIEQFDHDSADGCTT